jgi:hypothetical protein
MRTLDFVISGILVLVATVTTAFPLTAQETNRIKLAQIPVSAFADGEYELRNSADTEVNSGRFGFWKNGNQVTGIYSKGPSGICIEGTINGNLIVGKGYSNFNSLFSSPQSAVPRFTPYKSSVLQLWDGNIGGFNLKVAKQVILYLRVDNAFQLWSKYRTVVLSLDSYQKQSKLLRYSPYPKKCELRHARTKKALSESELQVFVP